MKLLAIVDWQSLIRAMTPARAASIASVRERLP